MKKPHKHAEIIKAWADGKEIEFRASDKFDFSPVRNPNPGWNYDYEYRIKPEPKYPETRMSHDELASLCEERAAFMESVRYVANAAIRRAIQDGDVVLPEVKA